MTIPSNSQTTPRRFNLWPFIFLAINVGALFFFYSQIKNFFRPSEKIVVTRMDPQGVLNPESSTLLSLHVNCNLDPETVNEKSIMFIPEIKGKAYLDQGNQIKFQLFEKLKRATRYQVLLSPELRGKKGESPAQSFYYFTTTPLEIISVHQAKIEANNSSLVLFTFNTPVNPLELKERLKISYLNQKPVSFQVLGGKPDKSLYVRIPFTQWDKVIVTLSKGLAGTEGALGMEKDYSAEVLLPKELVFTKMNPVSYDSNSYIEVDMNSPIDLSVAKNFISLEPSLPFNVESYERGMLITGDFKAGQRYLVTLKKGLPAGAAGILEKDLMRSVWFPDKTKSQRFVFEGGFLSPNNILKIPIQTYNTNEVKVLINRLYASNIVEYVLQGTYYMNDMLAQGLPEIDVKINNKKNEAVETLLDLNRFIPDNKIGVFSLGIKGSDYWISDQTILVITDLGVSVRMSDNKAFVWVTSLSSAEPVKDAKLSLYTDRRQKIGEGMTNEKGLASFELKSFPKSENPGLLVVSKGDDLSFVSFCENNVDRFKEGNQGRPYLNKGYEVFVYTDRNLYRAGETVKVSATIRDSQFSVPPSLPLTLSLRKPNRKEMLNQNCITNNEGITTSEINIPENSPSGIYRVQFFIPGTDQVLGETSFQVSDFLPQTLRLKVQFPEEPLYIQENIQVNAHVEHLFGEPAKGLTSACRVRYESGAFKHPEYGNYKFGDERVSYSTQSVELPEQTLDDKGNTVFVLPAPNISTSGIYNGSIEIEAREKGGRALIEKSEKMFHIWDSYIGVQSFKETPVAGENIRFHIVNVQADGELEKADAPVTAYLYKVNYYNLLKQMGGGRLQYEWTRQEEEFSHQSINLKEGNADILFPVTEAGNYRLLIDSQKDCPLTYDFFIQGKEAKWTTADPDKLSLKLDKKKYKPGESVKLSIFSPFDGNALVCIEKDSVLDSRIIKIHEGKGETEWIASESWRPNVYATVTLIRPVRPEDDWQPHRASGQITLEMDSSDRSLNVQIETLKESSPKKELEVNITVEKEGTPLKDSSVILFLVDEGVLSIKKFKTPSPWDYFYSLRCLDIKEYDFYSRLTPVFEKWKYINETAPGGGEGADIGDARITSPLASRKAVTPVLWQGPFTTDENGKIQFRCALPEFIGELRVMAIAVSGNQFGSAEAALTVKNPLMARISWPRFLSAGDTCALPVTLFNKSPQSGNVSINCDIKGPVLLKEKMESVSINSGEEKTIFIPMEAQNIGNAAFSFSLKMGALEYNESVEIPVRPSSGFLKKIQSWVLNPGETKEIVIDSSSVPNTFKGNLTVGGNSLIELTSSLNSLLDYPYGCLEQTISKLFPLIYLKDWVSESDSGIILSEDIEQLFSEGLIRLTMMQTYGSGFGMWPGTTEPDPFASIYAADFLVEARKGGYDTGSLYANSLQYLKNQLQFWITYENENSQYPFLQEAAYASYVLAKAGETPYSWITTLEEKISELENKGKTVSTTVYFYLAGAFLASGEIKEAEKWIGENRVLIAGNKPEGFLNSQVRELALQLSLLLDINPQSEQIPGIVEKLKSYAVNGSFGSTQDNAFAVMALGKYARKFPSNALIKGLIKGPDGIEKEFDTQKGLKLDDLVEGGHYTITLNSAQDKALGYVFLNTQGIPQKEITEEKDSGLILRRELFESDGVTPAKADALVQGKLYQIRYTLQSQRTLSNMLLLDLLPAGLEIENPDLGAAALAQKGGHSLNIVHREMKDDRLVLFFSASNPYNEYRYLVRAVTQGDFIWPASEASCMYDFGLFSINGRRKISIHSSKK